MAGVPRRVHALPVGAAYRLRQGLATLTGTERVPPTGRAPAQSTFAEIAVCICTAGRNAELARTLDSIAAQTWIRGGGTVSVVLVDNNATPAARPVLTEWANRTGTSTCYRHVSVHNLSVVRNEALRLAAGVAPVAALIDDDEVASPGWLESLLRTMHETGAPIIIGPVRPAFPPSTPEWASACGVFDLATFSEGERLSDGITGNALLAVRQLRDRGIRFDEALGLSGGEDQLYFRTARAAGMDIRYSAGAVITEPVPAQRLKLTWMLRREFRKGNTLGWIASRRPWAGESPLRRAAAAGKTFTVGILMVTQGVGRRSRWRFVAGLLKLCRAAGTVAGLVGWRLNVYGS